MSSEGQTHRVGRSGLARAASGWRAAILLGLPALVVVAIALFVSTVVKKTQPAEDGVIVITEVSAEIRTDGVRRSERVRLPYHWDAYQAGQQGTAVFTAAFQLAQALDEPWGLELPKIGNGYEVRLNGLLLENRGKLDEFNGSNFSLLPRYVAVGESLHQGNNLLELTIRADRGRDAGLSEIVIGPGSQLRHGAIYRYNWIFGSTVTFAAVSLAVGLLSLGFLRSSLRTPDERARGDRALYLYAALAELTEAASWSVLLVYSPPVSWPWWSAFVSTIVGASVCLIMLFCIETARWGEASRSRQLRWWLATLVLAGPAAAHAATGYGLVWALTMWYAGLGTTVAAFAAVFVARALTEGASLEQRLASIAIMVNMGAGVHDLYAFESASDFLHVTTLPYASLLFDLMVAAIMILRFQAARERVWELSRTLADKVAERERELGQSYQRLEQLAREQERMKERAVILRDMHDGVGAHLSIALRQIETGHSARDDVLPPLRDALDQLKLTIDNVTLPAGDVASLMGNLRYRLGPRIESSGIRLDWNVSSIDSVDRLDGQAMRQLMFILFESISNALQHSKATGLRIEACETPDGIRLRVADNGVGFDVASSSERGLLTMKNRADCIGAELEIRSGSDGTRVDLVIPRENGGWLPNAVAPNPMR